MGMILLPLALLLVIGFFPAIYLAVQGLSSLDRKQPGLAALGCLSLLLFGLFFLVPFYQQRDDDISWTFVIGLFMISGGLLNGLGTVAWIAYASRKKAGHAILGAACFLVGSFIPVAWFAMAESLMALLDITFTY